MAKFITLHLDEPSKPVVKVNVDYIVVIRPHKRPDTTNTISLVHLKDSANPIWVKETPEEIEKLLNGQINYRPPTMLEMQARGG